MPECQATTRRGLPCQAPAVGGGRFCRAHRDQRRRRFALIVGAIVAFVVGLVAFLGNLSQFLGFVSSTFGVPIPGAPPEKPASVYCAKYIADMTYPDGTVVDPGASMDKVWRIANCGDGNWRGLKIIRTEGGFGPEEFDAPATPPNGVAEISTTLVAPAASGRQRATYAIRGPQGPFRDGFWIEIVVRP